MTSTKIYGTENELYNEINKDPFRNNMVYGCSLYKIMSKVGKGLALSRLLQHKRNHDMLPDFICSIGKNGISLASSLEDYLHSKLRSLYSIVCGKEFYEYIDVDEIQNMIMDFAKTVDADVIFYIVVPTSICGSFKDVFGVFSVDKYGRFYHGSRRFTSRTFGKYLSNLGYPKCNNYGPVEFMLKAGALRYEKIC